MVSPVLEKELHRHLADLPLNQQRRVVDFARALATEKVRGVAGENFVRFAGTIEPGEVELISQAIEENCEKVDSHGW